MKHLELFILYLFFQIPLLSAQHSSQDSTLQYRIAFYNVENLFDPANDSLKNDDDFTPEGFNHWSYKKMRKKIHNIAKVLLAMGEGDPPILVGLAEIENDFVLKQLCYNSPLKKYKYQFIHYESPDMRGIDVALLYRKNEVCIAHSEAVPIVFPFESQSKNRDVLYVISTFPNGDSLHLFINHWTSRYGGYAATVRKRNYYAQRIKEKTDSLLQCHSQCNILITGDFNDYATDESLTNVLQAKELSQHDSQLYNLMFRFLTMPNIGTHKREDFWGCLDQMIVSASLLDEKNSLFVINQKVHIFNADFMIEPDEKYGGEKLYRTYAGPKYLGGYSDHLPIYLDIQMRISTEN